MRSLRKHKVALPQEQTPHVETIPWAPKLSLAPTPQRLEKTRGHLSLVCHLLICCFSPGRRLKAALRSRQLHTDSPAWHFRVQLWSGSLELTSRELPASGTTAREEVQACRKCYETGSASLRQAPLFSPQAVCFWVPSPPVRTRRLCPGFFLTVSGSRWAFCELKGGVVGILHSTCLFSFYCVPASSAVRL